MALKGHFDIALACDTDHDRHGIVTKSKGLLPPNHYLAVCVHYLFSNRPGWSKNAAIGKTVVTSTIIDRISAKLARKLYEVPVGFKFFVEGLLHGDLGFAGEESAGASFLRRDGTVWTTDKDGIIAALLAAEITAKMKKDPGELYFELTKDYGDPLFDRIEAPATRFQKASLERVTRESVKTPTLAGETIRTILTNAPGDGASIGGVKVVTESGWFAARPSGTEDIYEVYAESFKSKEHLQQIEAEAQVVVGAAFSARAS